MALGFTETTNSGGGDFLPIVKYSAKDGSFVRQDRHQAPDGTWEKAKPKWKHPLRL